MRKPKHNGNAYPKPIVERDQARADRDFLLRFVEEIGAALNADVIAAQLLAVRAMVRLAGEG
jgi:hypothetical protein